MTEVHGPWTSAFCLKKRNPQRKGKCMETLERGQLWKVIPLNTLGMNLILISISKTVRTKLADRSPPRSPTSPWVIYTRDRSNYTMAKNLENQSTLKPQPTESVLKCAALREEWGGYSHWRLNINWPEPRGVQGGAWLTSTRPCASVYAHRDTSVGLPRWC